MKSGLALGVFGAALALAFAAAAQPATAPAVPAAAKPAARKAPAVDPATLQGLPSARDYRPPEGVAVHTADLFSEGVRLTAQWFSATEAQGRKLPTVIIAPGWGATAATLRQDAVDLARAGFRVMLFDYRGWGDSDGRMTPAQPRSPGGGTVTGEMRELRGYVDPWEQAEDWFNAISYAATDPEVDAARIGVLGSDLAGGHVLYAAAHEPRIKALASLVSVTDTRPFKPYQPDPAKVIAEANAAASRLATGQPPDPAGAGAARPVGNKLLRWAPGEQANLVAAPALFVLAEKEERFSNTANGQQACERVTGPRKLVMLPAITHYGAYGLERQRAINAAIDWFDRYLKPPGAPTRVPINRKEPERGECNPPPLPPAGEEDKAGSGQGHKAQATSGRFN